MTRWRRLAFRTLGVVDVAFALVGIALHIDETGSIPEILGDGGLRTDYTPWFWVFYFVLAPIALFLTVGLILAGIRLLRLDVKGLAIHAAVLCGEMALLTVFGLTWAILGFVPASAANGDGYALTCLGPQLCILYPAWGLVLAWAISGTDLAQNERVRRLIVRSVPVAAGILLLSACGLGLRTLYGREIAVRSVRLDDVLSARAAWPAFGAMYRHCSSALRPSSRPSEFRELLAFCRRRMASDDPAAAVRGAVAMSAILAFSRPYDTNSNSRLDILDGGIGADPFEFRIPRAVGWNRASWFLNQFEVVEPCVVSTSVQERIREQRREESLQPPDSFQIIVTAVGIDSYEKDLEFLSNRCPASLKPIVEICMSEVRGFRKRFGLQVGGVGDR